MASWKKIIVSGSNAELNHITSSGNLEVAGNISGSSISTGSFGVVESAGDVIARNKAGAFISGPTNKIQLHINTGQRHFLSDAATGGVAAGAGASVTGDGVSIGYLTTAGGGSSVAIGRGLTTTANQVRIGESGVTDAYLGQGNATLHIGAINSSGNISGSITSTGSFGHIMKGGVNFDTAVSSSAAAAGFGGGGTITALNNQTANRLVTIGSTTTELDGEANLTFDGTELRVQGDIVAENFIVSSSVTYMTQSFSSGSTIFGNTLDDTHQFTGSLLVTGSATITGNVTGSGNLEVAGNISGSVTSTGSFGRVSTGKVRASQLRLSKNATEASDTTISIEDFGGGNKLTLSNGATSLVYDGRHGQNTAGLNFNVNFSGMLGNAAATSTNPSIKFTGDTDTGLGRADANQLSLIAGGVEALRVTETLISGSASSTGSFGKLQVGGATIQIPSNGFITMGSEEGMVKNTRFGNNAGQNLESGGTQNVLIGEDAGAALTTGDTNVAVGSEALKTATGDSNNVAIGRRALHDLNATNARNVAVGTGAGDGMTSGTENVLLGHATNTSAVDGTNQIVIGSSVTGLGDNQTVIGNSSQTHVVFGGDALISGSAASTGSFGSLILADKIQGDVTVGGNLIVEGDTIQQQVSNLNIEDRFILLNSGSASGDGGLIVQTESHTAGVVYGYDDDESRWGFQQGTKLSATGSAIAPDAYASAVVTSDDANYQKNGNIRVEGGEIYIYVE